MNRQTISTTFLVLLSVSQLFMQSPACAQDRLPVHSNTAIASASPGADDDVAITDIHLFGVIASNQNGRSQVLLSLKNQTARLVRSGETIGGWRIGEINLQFVDFERNGISTRVQLSNSLAASKIKPVTDIRSATRAPANYPGPIVSGTPGLE